MNIMKKACGFLAVAALGFNIAACSTADEGGVKTSPPVVVVVPVAQDDAGNSTPLTVNPTTVDVGTPATLSWTVKGAKECTASGNTGNSAGDGSGKWKGNQATSGSVVVGPYDKPGSYTYVLTCKSDTGGVLSQTATLNVGKPVVTVGVNLIASSVKAKPGDTISLNWTTSGNPAGCTASSNPEVSGWTSSMPTMSSASGTWLTLPKEGSYVFTLTCSNASGSASSSVPVTVGTSETSAVPLLTIASNPASVTQGTSSLIRWKTANVMSCKAESNQTADGWKGSTQPNNDVSNATPTTFTTANTLSPGPYSYGLDCTGPGGNVSESAQLTVTGSGANPAPTLAFEVSNSTTLTGNNSTTIKVGDVAYLSWVSTNAKDCVATGGMWAPSAQPTSKQNLAQGPFNSPGIYDFALSCINDSGSSVAQVVEVKVTSNGPSVTFTAQPNPGTQGTPATLVWTASSDATSCTAVSGPMQDTTWTGAQPISGSHAVPASVYNNPGTYKYVLKCTSPTGTTEVPVDFTVKPSSPSGPQFTDAFTATPISHQSSGGTSQLTWTTTNATACTASSNPAVTGWSGSQPTSSAVTGVPVVFPANAGTAPVSYTLQLTCTNASGSTTQTQVVTVQGTKPEPIVELQADPVTVVAGPNATTTLTYTTGNVTTCKTDGAGATGVWTAPTPNAGPTPVTGTAVSTPMTVAGSYTYKLICEGPNGTKSAEVTVTATTPQAPSFTPVGDQSPTAAGLLVTTASGTKTPAKTVAPGGNLYFSWASENATSCVPSSTETGASTSGWAKTTTGTSGADVVAKASNVPGFYTYTITCTGPTNPPASSTVSVLVVSPTASYCPNAPTAGGMATTSMALLVDSTAPSYVATTPSATGDSLCLGCSVGAPPNVLGNVTNAPVPASPATVNFPYGFTDYAAMILPIGVFTANAEEINVRNSSATPVIYPAGRTVNVGLVVPNSLLLASVIGNVSVSTTLNGVPQDVIPPGLLSLQVLGVIGSGSAGYATLPTTKPFDGVRVNFGGTVTAVSPLEVHMACVSL